MAQRSSDDSSDTVAQPTSPSAGQQQEQQHTCLDDLGPAAVPCSEEAAYPTPGVDVTAAIADSNGAVVPGEGSPSGSSSGEMTAWCADAPAEGPCDTSAPCLSARSLVDPARHAAGADDGSSPGAVPDGDLVARDAAGRPATPQPGSARAAPEPPATSPSMDSAVSEALAQGQRARAEAGGHQEPPPAHQDQRSAPGHPLTLEWLRDASEDAAREYLMGVGGARPRTSHAAIVVLVAKPPPCACLPPRPGPVSWGTATALHGARLVPWGRLDAVRSEP